MNLDHLNEKVNELNSNSLTIKWNAEFSIHTEEGKAARTHGNEEVFETALKNAKEGKYFLVLRYSHGAAQFMGVGLPWVTLPEKVTGYGIYRKGLK